MLARSSSRKTITGFLLSDSDSEQPDAIRRKNNCLPKGQTSKNVSYLNDYESEIFLIHKMIISYEILRGFHYAKFLLICLILALCEAEDEGPYSGRSLGKINSYHHQVSGEAFAVDEHTILLVEFNYDGNGADTFFWAGGANRPGPQGFIVPDEQGKTNVLSRYFNKEVKLTLPDKKKLSDIKWLAVYDIGSQNTFGDIYIPPEFEPPSIQTVGRLTGGLRGVDSEAIEILDAKTIRIPQFSYDGTGKEVYFWMGVGAQPNSKGSKVPDEYGYLDPIRAYKTKDIVLQLPGETTIFDIAWLAVFDLTTNENLGSVIMTEHLNVPPSLVTVIPQPKALTNCIQLHKDLQVSWDIFGPAITIQLVGQLAENDYMAFGLSGSMQKSEMLGADVAIAYLDGALGYATDYNITAKAPCVKVLGQYKGVCRDSLVGGIDSNQLHTASRQDGLNIVTYRRSLISADHGDKEFPTEGSVYVVWAMGQLDENHEPMWHDIFPRGNIRLELNRQEPYSECFAFTRPPQSETPAIKVWPPTTIFDSTLRSFTATIGPAGGKSAFEGFTGAPSPGLCWYVNGKMAPELWMRRGLTYHFKVYGGNDPHSADLYHPLIITDEPRGGLERLQEAAISKIRVLAGVEYSRRGQAKPIAAGPLCLAEHQPGADRRRDDDFISFKKFNRTLTYKCETGDAAILELTPNSTWPDTVYYNSYTQSHMGWKIHIVDTYTRGTASNLMPINIIIFNILGICFIHLLG